MVGSMGVPAQSGQSVELQPYFLGTSCVFDKLKHNVTRHARVYHASMFLMRLLRYRIVDGDVVTSRKGYLCIMTTTHRKKERHIS